MKSVYLILTFLFLFCSQILLAQVFTMAADTVITCSGNFYDSGSDTGSYGNNENLIMVFCPDSSGMCITADFTSFETEDIYDFLYIFDGPGTNDPQVTGSPFTGIASPGTVISTDITGCLTFRFTSDLSVTKAGWSANILCNACSGYTCTGTTPPCSNPPPGLCLNTCDLDTLLAPPACPGTTGAVSTFCLNNIGATVAEPYIASYDCQPFGSMQTVSSYVWYRFVASANFLDVLITGNLNDPVVGLFEGTGCNNLFGRGCAVGSGNLLWGEFQALTPGAVYYLQIGGGSPSDQGNFTLTLTSYNQCNDCLLSSYLTVTPLPVDGAYGGGQTVNFCFTVNNWNQTAVNWIHGVEIDFGDGWDLNTLVPGQPVSCDSSGYWAWYDNVIGYITGDTFGPGFFYDSPLGNIGDTFPDGNPGDNYGEDCTGLINLEFCWSIQTDTCPVDSNNNNLGIYINTTGDFESGSWTSAGCLNDPVYYFFASLNCCSSSPEVAIDTNITYPSCGGSDGMIHAIVSYGSPPYYFLWDDSAGQTDDTASGLPAGVYHVTVTDNNGCTGTAMIFLNNTGAPELTIGTIINPVCYGDSTGSATVLTSGGTLPFIYLWSDSFSQSNSTATGLTSGSYFLSVTDSNNCLATSEVTLTEPDIILLFFNATNASCGSCNDGVVDLNLTGGTLPYSFSWSTGDATEDLVAVLPGTYSVTVYDIYGCTATGSALVDYPVDGNFNEQKLPFIIYPIPGKDIIYLKLTEGDINKSLISIYSSTGQQVFPSIHVLSNDQISLDFSGWNAGVYFLRIFSEQSFVYSRMVLLE